MSVTSGFFNSLNHDRRYSAQQMSAIFDGIINDGVFANIGVAFAINADTGVTITIGKGKAWFNSAWVYNDALLPKTLEGSEVVLDRIDAVVIEVDHNESVRMGDIKIVKGTPSSSPQRPVMVNTEKKSQHPLAYIYRKAGSTEITQADITNMVGTSSCPYITGILQVQNIDNIVAQWEGQWTQWYAEKIGETDADASELIAEMQSEFDIWFADFKSTLSDDMATHLAAQVADLMGKFDDLARESAVYDTIEDSYLGVIYGSDGTPIHGKTVLAGNGGGGSGESIDLSGYATKKDLEGLAPKGELERVEANKLDRTEKFAVNLLDNSDFSNPVNQRGKTTYNGSGYTIDRWKMWNSDNSGILTVNNGHITIKNANLFQYLEGIDVDAIYTFAVKYVGEEPKIVSGTFSAGASGDAVSFGKPDGRSPEVRIYTGRNVEWAALYEGEYTADTLPEYRPKGYGAELAECMRYFYSIKVQPSAAAFLIGHNYTASAARFVMRHPVKMRAAPTLSYTKGTELEIVQNNGYTAVTSLSATSGDAWCALLTAEASGLTQRAVCGLNAPGATFMFSADL